MRYKLETRTGIWAIIDTEHESFADRGNGLHGDEDFVVCSWNGTYCQILGHFEVPIEKRISAKQTLSALHSVETTLRAELAAARAKAERMESERNNWEETANLYARNSAYHEEGRDEARAKAVELARTVKDVACCRLCVNFDEPGDSSTCFDCTDNSNFEPGYDHKTAASVLEEWK